jgi:hypothetical protein
MQPEGSLPQTQKRATCPILNQKLYQRTIPSPRQLWMVRSIVFFYGEEL